MAEPGRDQAFVIVLIPGGPGRDQAERDFSHLGFALDSEAAVDAVADLGRQAGCLIWEPRREPYPVGYYCGPGDPTAMSRNSATASCWFRAEEALTTEVGREALAMRRNHAPRLTRRHRAIKDPPVVPPDRWPDRRLHRKWIAHGTPPHDH
jgi:hypothetical protein